MRAKFSPFSTSIPAKYRPVESLRAAVSPPAKPGNVGDNILATTRIEKLNGLELLRFVSGVAVVVWHYQHFYFQGGQPIGFHRALQPFFSTLKPFYLYGHNGVEVFWCISGFIFFWKYARQINNHEISAAKFAWLRFTRLYPLHLVTLLVVALLHPIYEAQTGTFFVYEWNDLRHFLLNLFFASKWGLEKGLSFNGPVWSISIEVLVYALFFVTTYFIRVSIKRALIYALFALCFVIPVESRQIVQSAVFCFYVGGLMSLINDWLAQFKRPRWFLTSIAIAVGGLITALLWRVEGTHRLRAVAVAATLILVLVMNDHLFNGRFLGRVSRVGNLTYSSYLIHFPLQLTIVTVLGAAAVRNAAAFPSFFLFYVAATFALAYFAYYKFELPVQQFLRGRVQSPKASVQLKPGTTPG